MKKIIIILLVFTIVLSITSCGADPSAESMLSDFVVSYGAVGVIYSPRFSEGEPGYITDGLFSEIYIYDGTPPENYAIFLNSYADYGSECAVFVCSDEAECERVVEACRERTSLLGRGEGMLLLRSGYIVFYSTMTDAERAEAIWRKIIREYT